MTATTPPDAPQTDEPMANGNGYVQASRIILGVVQSVSVIGIVTIAAMLYEQKAEIAVISATMVTSEDVREIINDTINPIEDRLNRHIEREIGGN